MEGDDEDAGALASDMRERRRREQEKARVSARTCRWTPHTFANKHADAMDRRARRASVCAYTCPEGRGSRQCCASRWSHCDACRTLRAVTRMQQTPLSSCRVPPSPLSGTCTRISWESASCCKHASLGRTVSPNTRRCAGCLAKTSPRPSCWASSRRRRSRRSRRWTASSAPSRSGTRARGASSTPLRSTSRRRTISLRRICGSASVRARARLVSTSAHSCGGALFSRFPRRLAAERRQESLRRFRDESVDRWYKRSHQSMAPGTLRAIHQSVAQQVRHHMAEGEEAVLRTRLPARDTVALCGPGRPDADGAESGAGERASVAMRLQTLGPICLPFCVHMPLLIACRRCRPRAGHRGRPRDVR